MDLLAGTSAEYVDAAAVRGFTQKASKVVDKAQVELDNLDAIVRVYDEQENYAARAIAARNAPMRAEHRLMVAKERYVAALDMHSRFVNARVEASARSLVHVDNREKPQRQSRRRRNLSTPSSSRGSC